MRGTDIIHSFLILSGCVLSAACTAPSAAGSEPAKAPTSTASPSPSPAELAESAAEAPAGPEMDEVQFEDKGADGQEATERTPPPTKAWKPMDKEQPGASARKPANK